MSNATTTGIFETVTFEEFDTLRRVAADAVFDWSITVFNGDEFGGITRLPALIDAGPVLADLCYPGEPIDDEWLEYRSQRGWDEDAASAMRVILTRWSELVASRETDHQRGEWWTRTVRPSVDVALAVLDRLAEGGKTS